MEEGEEECGGEWEDESGEGLGETLLGEGPVGVEDAWGRLLEKRLYRLEGYCPYRRKVQRGVELGGLQKKRPFQILRSSISVNVRPQQR